MAALLLAGCKKPVADGDGNGVDNSGLTAAPTPLPTPDYAPPGPFFLLSAVRKETKDGVLRLLPGTEVKLLRNGKYQTPEGEMALDAKLLTNDRTVARAAQNSDLKTQAAVRPKGLPAMPAPAPIAAPPVLAINQTGATPVPSDADAKVRSMKFRLTVLKNEESKLQDNANYLFEKAMRSPKVQGAPTGLSGSTSLSDLANINARLTALRAEIQDLESKLQSSAH